MQRLAASLLFGALADGLRHRRKQASAEQAEDINIPGVDDFPKCHLSESDCNVKDMAEATLVYTDSDTSRCWNGDPWAFLVHPGAADKLMLYMTGGGACWEYPTWLPGDEDKNPAEMCADTLEKGVVRTAYGNGAMDFGNADNVFKDYTVVGLPYCTGGAHVANTTITQNGKTFYQYDYNNNEIARAWALRQTADGPPLKSFVLMGSSGGALGGAAWSDVMLSSFKYERAAVVLDSFMGVFPEGTQGPTFLNFRVCSLPLWQRLPRKFRDDCEQGNGNLQDIFDYTIGKYPDVAFAHIQPKSDPVQIAFFAAVALTYLKRPHLVLAPTLFYSATNEMMRKYNQHPNYVVYYVDGPTHCFLPFPWWYQANVKGFLGAIIKPRDTPSLSEWFTKVVNHEEVHSECHGLRLPNVVPGSLYCDKELYPKTLRLA